jgi:SNF2 family DNA or RNA helicase
MYKAAVGYWESRGCQSGPEEVGHLGVITALKKICNHPSLVKRPRQSEQLTGEVQSDIINWKQMLCYLSVVQNLLNSF